MLSLSTSVRPASLFLLDGEEYSLLTFDHLSPSDTATAQALFSRYATLAVQLEAAMSEEEGARTATRLGELRLRILEIMTNVSSEVLAKMPTGAQARLLEAVQDEVIRAISAESDADS